jgi:hypothetical protein
VRSTWGRTRSWKAAAALGSPRRNATSKSASLREEAGGAGSFRAARPSLETSQSVGRFF